MKRKKWMALLLVGAMLLALGACGASDDTAGDTSDTTQPEDAGATAEPGESSPEQQVYTVGICEYMQHPALDQATAGFEAALVEKLGEDGVEFVKQNAAGDAPTCATICNQLVSDGVDLIWPMPPPLCRPRPPPPMRSPSWAPRSPTTPRPSTSTTGPA